MPRFLGTPGGKRELKTNFPFGEIAATFTVIYSLSASLQKFSIRHNFSMSALRFRRN
jgi:hypothetical protein